MNSAQYDVHAPGFSLRIAGGPAPEALSASLAGWRVSQHLSKPAMCELTFRDFDAAARGALRLGDECELADVNGAPIFSGSITSIRREKRSDGLRALVVRAHDALDRLRQRQAMKVREPGALASVLSGVVAGVGLDVDADEDGPQLPLMVQWGTNGLDWIGNICATYGRYFYLHGRTLRLMSLHGGRDSAIELDINEDSLFEAWIESSALGLRTEATACAWNPLKIEAYRSKALDFTLEAVPEWEGVPAELTNAARDIVGGAGPQDESVVSRVAQADLDRAGKRAHRFGGLADGDALFVPGARIVLTGFDDDAREEFALTSVEHAYTAESGYTSLLSSEPPADPIRLLGPAISLGVVSNTNDPDAAGRVKAQLKAFNDAESDWLNVCSIGAGESKGFVSQPEEGDSVLIAFVNDNPAQGVVLGGLFGAHALHDEDVRNNRPRPCSLRTRDGQSLRLDDQAGAIKLKSRGGVFDLNPGGVVLQSDADLRIAAPGRRITIVADKIDFQRG